MVGRVVTTSPSFSLYSTVVLPALSKPIIRMRHGVLGKNRSIRVEIKIPMMGF